ncbi:MAG: ErmE/ErmH/ErmO/ErmR family 23S rRNA (adenine(2058)-N(6))-methyltransferase [Stackebrandtia sp.]
MARSRFSHRSRSNRSPRASARRKYSQNFLVDHQVAAAVVRLSGVARDDLVVEVGPGDGMLTKALARKAGKVLAYEIDPVYARRLAERYRDDPRVRCVRGDFLAAAPPRGEFAVVANIPYSRTGGVVDWCLRAPGLTSATLMTQLEYARKRTGDFGRWSQTTVESWPRFEWTLRGRVDRGKFDPAPRADSGILQLTRRDKALLPRKAMPQYRALVRLGFTGVGGSLRASLRRGFGAREVGSAFADAELDPRTVVGYVTPQQWIEVFRALYSL